jgi:FixJ family two-component response regulator
MNEIEMTPTVFLVDDDASVRSALTRALTAEGFHVLSWASADTFLADYDPDKPGCVVADVAMPGTDGLQLQSLLSASDHALPIVFITGNATVRMSVQAMRAGAVTFLPKPVRLSELAAAVREALERDRATRQKHAARSAIQARLAALTARTPVSTWWWRAISRYKLGAAEKPWCIAAASCSKCVSGLWQNW